MHLFFFFGQINFLTSRFLRFFEDFINHIFLIGLKYKIVWSITEILCVNTVNSNSLFTHCLRKGKKKGVAKFATPWFWKWTSLGLNQGPPDYESVALTNWATSPVLSSSDSGHKNSIFSWNMQTFRAKYTVCCFVFRTYTYVWGSWGTNLSLRGLLVQRLPWWSRTKRKQIRPRGTQSRYSLRKARPQRPRCPI